MVGMVRMMRVIVEICTSKFEREKMIVEFKMKVLERGIWETNKSGKLFAKRRKVK